MKYYCIGIKGAGMSTLAQILYDLGNEVIGYDDVIDYKFTEEGLKKRNIKIYHDNEHNLDKDTIVTYSAAFNENHKEIQRLKEAGYQFKKYHEILGELTSMFKTISVCGTHGKTTTSTLITHILHENCNYFIGDGSGFAKKENKIFVIESCEYNRHFLAYHPTISVLTNIELEHTEVYKDINDIIKTFEEFVNKSEIIIACGDDENIRKIKTNKKIYYYGFNDNNDIFAKNVELTHEGASFDVYYNKQLFGHFEIPLFGSHMVLNALASIMISILFKIDKKEVHEQLKTFKNAKRRFCEEKYGNNIIIDDYAHHPTELKVTLQAARQKYPDKKIIAIFKPNTYSRTKDFRQDFIDVLNMADKAYVTPIDCNREKQSDYPGITSNSIIEGLKNGEIITEDTTDKLKKYDNAVLCFMSCASVAHLIENYKKQD